MYIWNHDGVRVLDVMTIAADGQVIKGHAIKDGERALYHVYEWEARVNPQGWEIVTRTNSGRVESFQGSTFNLVLEVATAIRRAL
jgi:hypothetical protein